MRISVHAAGALRAGAAAGGGNRGNSQIERTVLSLYYHEDLTLREIAEVVNLHESRISQLKSQAILRLRSHLREQWPASQGHGTGMSEDRNSPRMSSAPNARTLLDQWSECLAQVLESMTDQRPEVHWQYASGPLAEVAA